MAEFGDKIQRGSGTITFSQHPSGAMMLEISGFFRAMYQIAVGFDGSILCHVPCVGVGATTPPYPQPSMLAWIQSDEQGLWGRRCPSCKTYFRTDHIGQETFCPYCSQVAENIAFITEAQRRYLQAFCEAGVRAMKTKEPITIDVASVTDVGSEWSYSEEQQQFHFKCSNCSTQADILGDYGWCPNCGRTNAKELIEGKCKALTERFQKADRNITERNERGEEWEKINNDCFSHFEAMGKHLQSRLILFPTTPKRKKETHNLNFQRLFDAADSVKTIFGIDLLEHVASEEQTFLKLMLQRRHIVVHNGGRVDEDYLKNSGDAKARLHQRIRVDSNQINRLIPIIRVMSLKLIEGVDSIGG